MSSFQLKAEKREKLGSLEARRIKNAGRIPAVIYSKNGNINISVDKREFEIEFSKGNIQTRIAEIEVGGIKIKAIAHKIELDPVSDHPIHIDLLNCEETKGFKAQAKLNFTNRDKSPGLKKGGFLHIVLRKVEIVTDKADAIPESINVDVGSMQVGAKVRGSDLKLPAGVKLSKNNNFLIASVTGRGNKEEVETTAAAVPGAEGAAAPATGATGATPAAGATATPAAGAAKAPAAAEKKK